MSSPKNDSDRVRYTLTVVDRWGQIDIHEDKKCIEVNGTQLVDVDSVRVAFFAVDSLLDFDKIIIHDDGLTIFQRTSDISKIEFYKREPLRTKL